MRCNIFTTVCFEETVSSSEMDAVQLRIRDVSEKGRRKGTTELGILGWRTGANKNFMHSEEDVGRS